jgi:dipeptidyl aminopeptidase/acylaminoacyl peptidase
MRAGSRAGRIAALPAIAAVALVLGAPAAARPYSVEDMVHQESFGQVAFDPTGRRLVYERRVARAQAPRFADEVRPEVVENQLRVVDLSRPAKARPLIPGDPTGVTMGPFSPDGRRLAVYGMRGDLWRLGVVTLATGHVRWFPVTPEFPYRTRTLQWLSPTQLVAIDRPRDSLPLILKINSEGQRELPDRWRRAAHGELAVTAIGSGRYIDVRPRKAASHLVQVDVVSGRRSILAAGDIEDLEVAPDSRHIAFVEAGEDIRLVADRHVNGPYGAASRRERLGLVDVATGRVARPCPALDLAGQLLSWSPSGHQLLVFARPDGAPWRAGQALRVTPEGAVEALALGDGTPALRYRPEAARAVWLGEVPALLVNRGERQDWVASHDGSATVLTGALASVPASLQPTPDGAVGLIQGRAWKLTPTGAAALATPDDLEAAPPRRVQEARLSYNPPSPSAAVLARRVTDTGAWAVDIDRSQRLPPIPLPDAHSAVAAFAPQRQALAVTSADAHGVERLQLWAGGHWVLIDATNLGQNDVDPLEGLIVHHPDADRAPDGGALDSWLYLPPSRPGAPAPPLIVVPYPGQRHRTPASVADYGVDYLTPSLPALVGAGYAVLTPSLPLAATAEPVDGLGARVLAIVDAAAVQHPGAFDTTRLALWGHSFGGYGVMAIITQTDRFRAAIDMAGPSDLISIWGTLQAPRRVDPSEGLGVSGVIGWAEDAQPQLGGPPWSDPGRYLRNSPILQADHIHTPLLIMAGDQDHIPMSQGEEMFSALYRQDRDAMLLTYWGESHILYNPASVRDAYGRGFAWLAENLRRPVRAEAAEPAHSRAPGSATTAPTPR